MQASITTKSSPACSTASHLSRFGAQGWSAFRDIFQWVWKETGECIPYLFMTRHIQFFLSWAQMCRELSNSYPKAPNYMEEWEWAKLFSTDSDKHSLKETREDVDLTG